MNSTQEDFISMFNKKLLEFAEDLMYIFPTIYDFKMFKIACDWSITIDRYAPLCFFNHHIANPFHDKILTKDESFFLYETYDDCTDYIQHYGHDLNLIDKLKKIWQNLDEQNKTIIWRYMQVLLAISKKCTSKNLNELHQNIFVAKRV